jgi:hypothetical protein
MNRPVRPIALVTLVLLGSAGCGPRVYPVEGMVQYDDGSPAAALAGGTVSLESVADRSNASGQIGRDGAFRAISPTGGGGVQPGVHRVVVLLPEGADRRNPPVDPTYGRYETSGIEITVKEEPAKVIVTIRRPPGAKKG